MSPTDVGSGSGRLRRASRGRLWPSIGAGIISGITTAVVASAILANRDARSPTAAPAPSGLGEGVKALALAIEAAQTSKVSPFRAAKEEKRESASAADPKFEGRLAEAEERYRRAFSEKLAAHRYEALDTEWAEATSRQLSKDLADVPGEIRFTVKSIDCRSATCVAELEWPSAEDAAMGYQTAYTAALGVSCETELILPAGPAPPGPYRVPMHLRCRR